MNEFIIAHFPAIMVIQPIFCTSLILLFSNKIVANYIFTLSNLLGLAIILYIWPNFTGETLYEFGNWPSAVGISFKIDYFTLFMLTLFYLSTSLYLVGSVSLFPKLIQANILPGRKHLPIALLLTSSTGIIGIIITNDIFNLYVFLEIASICSYPLFAISKSRSSFVSAFEYLVLGTIGATMILVAIGLIYAVSGSLNLDIAKAALLRSNLNYSAIATVFLIGVFIKLAIFPFHFWKSRAYRKTSSLIANFFIVITSLAFISLLYKFRFLDNLLGLEQKFFIKALAYATMIFGSYRALKSDMYKEIIIFSSISTVGYYLLLWPFSGEERSYILCQFLFTDSLIKFALFMLPSILSSENLSIRDLIGITKKNRYIAYIFIIILLHAASLPPTITFFNKLYFASEVLALNIFDFIIFLASSCLGIFYNLRIARQMVKTSDIETYYHINYAPLVSVAIADVILIYALFRSDLIMNIAKFMTGNGI